MALNRTRGRGRGGGRARGFGGRGSRVGDGGRGAGVRDGPGNGDGEVGGGDRAAPALRLITEAPPPWSCHLFNRWGTLRVGEKFQWSIEHDGGIIICEGVLVSLEPSPPAPDTPLGSVTFHKTLTFHTVSSCGLTTPGTRFEFFDKDIIRIVRFASRDIRILRRWEPSDHTYFRLIEMQ